MVKMRLGANLACKNVFGFNFKRMERFLAPLFVCIVKKVNAWGHILKCT